MAGRIRVAGAVPVPGIRRRFSDVKVNQKGKPDYFVR
jgi:hypothetical protein